MCYSDIHPESLENFKMEASKAYFASIAVLLGSIVQIAAGTTLTQFKIRKNTRAELDIISVNKSSDLSLCTLLCTQTDGCNMANWIDSRCELLIDPAGEMTLIGDSNARFLCKYYHLYADYIHETSPHSIRIKCMYCLLVLYFFI